MENKAYPNISNPCGIEQTINELRNKFPPKVTEETVEQYANGEARKVINALQFIDVINADGEQNPKNKAVFSSKDFEADFSEIIHSAYSDLFDEYGDKAWKLDDLILEKFFENSDETLGSDGKGEAKVFKAFAKLSSKTKSKNRQGLHKDTGDVRTNQEKLQSKSRKDKADRNQYKMPHKKWNKKSAFEFYNTRQTNERWGWSAISDDGTVVAVTVWKDLIKLEDKNPYYDGFDEHHENTIHLWGDQTGNEDRKKHLKHALEYLDGEVRVVVTIAEDVTAHPRVIKEVYPYNDLWFKIVRFDENTGQFSLKFLRREKP